MGEAKVALVRDAHPDAPERWIQTYCSHPLLLNEEGARIWEEDEIEKEIKYITYEAPDFFFDDFKTKALLKQLFKLLHEQKLEPTCVEQEHGWRFGNALYDWQRQRIFDLDKQWQSVWNMWRQVEEWRKHLKEKLKMKIPADVEERFENFRLLLAQSRLSRTCTTGFKSCMAIALVEKGCRGKLKTLSSFVMSECIRWRSILVLRRGSLSLSSSI